MSNSISDWCCLPILYILSIKTCRKTENIQSVLFGVTGVIRSSAMLPFYTVHISAINDHICTHARMHAHTHNHKHIAFLHPPRLCPSGCWQEGIILISEENTYSVTNFNSTKHSCFRTQIFVQFLSVLQLLCSSTAVLITLNTVS